MGTYVENHLFLYNIYLYKTVHSLYCILCVLHTITLDILQIIHSLIQLAVILFLGTKVISKFLWLAFLKLNPEIIILKKYRNYKTCISHVPVASASHYSPSD